MFDQLLRKAERTGASYADLRVQRIRSHGLELRNGKIERAVSGREEGIGIQVLYKGGWGFHATNDATMASLERALSSALKVARSASSRTKKASGVADQKPSKATERWKPKRDPDGVDDADKQEVVRVMHDAVKAHKEVRSTTGSYGDRTTAQAFYSSEGAHVETEVTRTVAQVHFVARGSGQVTSRRIRIGAAQGFELFSEVDYAKKAEEAARATIRLLRAPAAPSGRMTVVTDSELTGVFSHEAVGHASEGDLVASGESCLAGKLGQRIGSPLVTLVDDGTIPKSFGSMPYDDQGVRQRRRVLVDKGVFRSYLLDRVAGKKLGQASSGSARAESYASRPLVRMSNTFIEPGALSFEELLEDVKDGVYAVGSRGGQVDTAKGSFQFSAQEAYRIRGGELAEPLRDVSLTGSTLETLANIDGVSKEWALGDPGYCGKGQWVPVGDGGPHLRIRDAIVGGSA
ncbi:MAG: TldD/PmbA family protein [Euryarchaeota archaeon]|nr:TldD/PmbA family protein [Euryarchaeota archaeon]